MASILYFHFSFSKTGNIIFPADASHKIREPGPHGKAIEFPQQGRMVKAYPASPALFDIMLKGGDRLVLPAIGRIVQLNDELVFAQVPIIDRVGPLDIIDPEIAVRGELIQPDLRSF